MITGIELIAQERAEQIEKHAYDAEHDKAHSWQYDSWPGFVSGEQSPLVSAALSFLNVDGEEDVNESIRVDDEFTDHQNIPECWVPRKWPFHPDEWRGGNLSKIGRLMKAGALIAAEIDRLSNLNPPLV